MFVIHVSTLLIDAANHSPVVLGSTHMTLMENPELVIEEAENFLIKEGSFVSKYIRKNSVRFEVKAEYIDN